MRLNFDQKSNLLQAFPTQVGRFTVPNAAQINPILEEIILARESRQQGHSKSNVGGWHSDIDFHMWPEVQQRTDIVETMQSAVSHMIATAAETTRFNLNCDFVSWANINRAGSHNAVHNHSNAHWSGVYYVTVPQFDQDDLPRAGNIVFYDPRGAVNMVVHPGRCSDGEPFEMAPRAGHMLLFPSWLYHSVNPFKSDVTRISIAFNARIDRFEELGG